MVDKGRKLFAKIHRQKHHANHNHDVHFMARELDDWLVRGVESMVNGSYTPRHLKRHYFPDEMVDQLHLSDRIFQNILLKQLKPTFPYVMNPNCYHLHGPSGVRLATQRIRQVLLDQNPKYIIRADIKSFYKSIPHHQLVQDIKQHYDDEKVQAMLEQIIINPIETPRGYKNADHGIALRGPLSQFFSGIYLKPLDRIVPHPRTLRKARENVKAMVNSGVSPCRIRIYLHRWSTWWVGTAQSWQYQKLLEWFLNVCWDLKPAAYAAGLLHHAMIKTANHDSVMLSPGFHTTA